MQAANQVATALSQAASASIDGLAGGSALVADDGTISAAELATFHDDMSRQADLRTVAHEVVVADADRDQYEADQGFPISDIGPDRQLVPAPRASHVRPGHGRRVR